MNKQLASFVEGLKKSGMLNSEQIDHIVTLAMAPEADPQVIARDIVQQGWLTPFQVKMIWKGRGDELIINQYVLVDRLGEGGMGEVYRARHRRMERDVALKVIRKERINSPEAIKRFQREIQTAAQLAHENIVMAYDADHYGDKHFFAMEYVEGTTLSRLIKDNGPMPIELACNCIRQAALGLEHALEKGMVHRDIKPSNLLLNKNGVLKILDMGLARLQDSPTGEDQSRITQEGLVLGTPDFLAPEQARNARTADVRADIYSLGCTFYFLLTGKPPYEGSTPTEKLLRHTVDPIPRINRSDVPPGLSAILEKMMAKKVEDRYQIPAEITYDLEPYCGALLPQTSGRHSRVLPGHPQYPPGKLLGADPSEYPESKEPKTESQFRLPPSQPLREPVLVRTRWNKPVALAISLLLLLAVVGAIWYFVNNNTTSKNKDYDDMLRGLGASAKADMPRMRVWPPQLSVAGFAPTFFRLVESPDEEGKRSSWIRVAGPVKIASHQYLLGMAFWSEEKSKLGMLNLAATEWSEHLHIQKV